MYWLLLLGLISLAGIQDGPDILTASTDGSTPIVPYSATTDGPSPI